MAHGPKDVVCSCSCLFILFFNIIISTRTIRPMSIKLGSKHPSSLQGYATIWREKREYIDTFENLQKHLTNISFKLHKKFS